MGKVIWVTGLSGSGKTTITKKVVDYLVSNGKSVKLFDGDPTWALVPKSLGFDPIGRKEKVRIIAQKCAEEKEKYDFIVVAMISSFKDSREGARRIIGKDFVEVFLNCPINVCIDRDVKGLYNRAFEGKEPFVVGVDPKLPYEVPTSPDVVLETHKESIGESVDKLISFL